jgi:hypothetical protein
MLSGEEEEDGKVKYILRVYTMVTEWVHSKAKLNSAIIGVSFTEYTNLRNLGTRTQEMLRLCMCGADPSGRAV